MNPIGPFPGSSPSYSSQVVSWGWHFPCHLGHQCTCFLGALSPTVRMITLNKPPHSTMDNLNIIFTSCCVGSSFCQPDRIRTRVYLWFVLATHTPMPLNPRGQVSLQHVTFTQYLPCCCHGRIQGERKLAFIFILATKYLCYFKQGTFSIFCFMRILDSVSEPRTFSPSTIYQGALWWWRPHALLLFSQKDLFPTSLSISILSLLSVSLFPLKTQVIVHKVLTRAFCIQIKSFTLFSKFFFLFNSYFFSFLPLHLSLRPHINLLPIPPFYSSPGMTLIPSLVDCFPGLLLLLSRFSRVRLCATP